MNAQISMISRWKTILMGFSALWIYLYHEWIFIAEDIPLVGGIEKYIINIGFCGVDIFLFLSGIGLVYSIQKHSLFTFYLHRIKRVFLPFFLSAVVIGLIDKWTLKIFLKIVSGYSFFFESMYTFLWFVPAVMTFYLFFPAYYFFYRKSPHKLLFTFSSLLIWLVASFLIKDILRPELYGFTNRIPIFITGIHLGWMIQYEDHILHTSSFIFFAILLVSGGIFSYLTIYQRMELLVPTSDCCVPNFCMSIALTFLLARFFDIIKIKLKVVSNILLYFFSFFGKISLEFYCMQEWVAEKIESTPLTALNPLFYNLLLFLIVVVCSYALYSVVQGLLKTFQYLRSVFL